MRSLWTGTLSFGLINIPVHLYSGTETRQVDLDMLHKKDLSPIRYAKICKLEEKEVSYKEIVKGYEYEDEKYVTITSEDFERIAKEKSDTIDIQFFLDEEGINTIFYDKPYFLEPAKGGKKAYLLLREAMKKSKKIALVKFVLRNHVHIGALKIYEDLLILNQLHYHSEIRSSEDLKIPVKEKASKEELKMACKLIDQLKGTFKPEKFEDTYAEDLDAIIQAKLKGKKVGIKKKKKKEEIETKDIMAKLKESLSKPRKSESRKRA